MGCSLDGFEVVVERKSLDKLIAILDNTSQLLHDLLVRQQSTFSKRLIQLCCSKEIVCTHSDHLFTVSGHVLSH